MNTLSLGACPAKPTRADLALIRDAHVIRINTAATKAMWGRNPESDGMPSSMFAVGCFLAAHGFEEDPCAGERWFKTDFAYYRAFLSTCPEIVEDGRRAIYEGRRALLPFVAMQVAA